MTNPLDRRQFTRLMGLSAVTATVPTFLHRTGIALAGDEARGITPIKGLKDDRVLVIVQLAGGNDGLNTVVPYADERYYKARPKIGVPKEKVHKLTDELGLHTEMPDFKKLYDDGLLAVVPNVGYPNPNRSHFKSMDVWETATPPERIGKTGWIGRYFDNECKGADSPMLGLRIGEQASLTFAAQRAGITTFANPAMLQDNASGLFAKGLDTVSKTQPTGIEALDYIQRTGNVTRDLSRRIQAAMRDYKPAVDYPPFSLCQSLKLVAQMIMANIPTRVYYVTLGGFDTHSGQMLRHPALLQELSQAVSLFVADLKAHQLLERTMLMTFSEFGRRVDENQQQGTDHGTANVCFVAGGKVKSGVHGVAPDLEKLDTQGDLIHKTDFRSVYAGVLKGWLGADPATIVGKDYAPLELVKG
jgi:uncharacterized protein (DUF1501 family)